MNQPAANRTLVIGVGNADRGDDGIGLAVLRKLRALDSGVLDYAESAGDPAELMELWQGRTQVEIVDACMTPGRAPGDWLTIDAAAGDVSSIHLPTSTHAFGLREALELGKILGNMPPSVRLWLICAGDFSPLQPTQPAVRAAGDEVAAAMQKLLTTNPS
jgi:hydrogenase maturation protease